jgi:hypothetical protein
MNKVKLKSSVTPPFEQIADLIAWTEITSAQLGA